MAACKALALQPRFLQKKKKSIPSGCKQNYNPNNSGGVETIACRRPKQKQLLWALIPQLILRNMTKLIHPPPTLFFSEEGRHGRERNRISSRIIRVPQLASWNQPALGSNDQAREPAGQLLMRCP